MDDEKAELRRRGRSSRNRGKDYERNCAKALQAVYPTAARLFGQARRGSDAPDVGNTPFWIECGTGSTQAIRAKLNQGLRDSATSENLRYVNKPVLAMIRTANGEHIVAMKRSEFIDLLAKIELAMTIIEDAGG